MQLINFMNFLPAMQYQILENLPAAVLVIDEYGKIKYANKSSSKLFETADLKDRNINDYFIINSDNIIKNKDENVKQILKIITEKENSKIADVRITDISSENKKQYLLVITDNTQDHSLLNRLIEEKQNQNILNHSKNVLLAKMESCLCPPLHSAAGFSQAMLSGLGGDLNEKQKKYLEIINSNSSELLLFIKNIILMSELEADIHKFEYTGFDITILLAACVNEFKVKIQNKDIRLSVDKIVLQSNSCFSDKNAVKTIMENLLINAAALMETGVLNIKLSNPEPALLLSRGINIPENLPKKSYMLFEMTARGIDEKSCSDENIFDPYVQIDKNSKKYLLQSLLLRSAALLIKKLKGSLWAEGSASNQVSFIFALPMEKSIIDG